MPAPDMDSALQQPGSSARDRAVERLRSDFHDVVGDISDSYVRSPGPRAEMVNDLMGALDDVFLTRPEARRALAGEAAAPTPGHDVRRVRKGADGRDERGPWEPCPTCGPASSNAGAPG